MKYIHFYALREDILPVLEVIERDGPLKYVRTGNALSPNFEMFLRGSDIPKLGIASYESGIGCDTYLVTKAHLPITVRNLEGKSGVQRYLMDQLLNPDTVTFTPAGLWGEDIVLTGRVATVSDSPIAQELMKRFNSAIKKQFTKTKAYQIGPQALALFNAGKRLTIAEQSPREFDLTAAPSSKLF